MVLPSGRAVLAFLSCALALLPVDVLAQSWVPLGPAGGNVIAVEVDPRQPDRVWAGTIAGGIFRSDDGGASFVFASHGEWPIYVGRVVADPNTAGTVWAATDNGLLKSTDGGSTWARIRTGLTGPARSLVALAVAPTTPVTIYAGSNVATAGAGARVLKSADGGSTWSILKLPPADATVSVLALDPSTPGTVWVGTDCCGGGLYKSTNGGSTWIDLSAGLPTRLIDTIAIDPTAPANVFVATAKGLMRSTTGGTKWQQVAGGLPFRRVNALRIDPSSASTIYASIGPVLYKTTDRGASWNVVGMGLGLKTVVSLAVDPTRPQRVLAGTAGGGLFASTNGATSFSAANAGLRATWIRSIAAVAGSPGSLFVGTHGSDAFASEDLGASWSAVGLAGSVEDLVFDPSTPSVAYALGDSGVQKSTDRGRTWARSSTGLPEGSLDALAMAPSSPNVLYVAKCGVGVWRSGDAAQTWTATGAAVNGRCVQSLAVDPNHSDRVYATAGDGWASDGVLLSEDGGQTWQPIVHGLATDLIPGELAIDPGPTPIVYLATSGGTAGLYATADSGANWTRLPGVTGEVTAVTVNPATRAVYIATPSGVLRSTDAGLTWTDVTLDLHDTRVKVLTAGSAPDEVYAGTASGVFALRTESVPDVGVTPPDAANAEAPPVTPGGGCSSAATSAMWGFAALALVGCMRSARTSPCRGRRS
jgi:photosystem II stability/assembly factor-like uncharacterized protein